jgi:hypothetical protein
MTKENDSKMGTILIILVLAGLGFLLYTLYNQSVKNNMDEEYTENFYNDETGETGETEENTNSTNSTNNDEITESFENSNNMDHFNSDSNLQEKRECSNFPKEQLGADDLLPSDKSSMWATVNPEGEGTLKDRNFLQSGYHVGVNTVGQTLRNANLQLRSEPPNPQVKVSPWLQTTINPDTGRKPMEIGGCA